MRDGFDHDRGLSHSMVSPNNHPNPGLRGQAKGFEIVLKERGFWLANGRRADGFRFLLQCPTNRGSCNQDDPDIQGKCCARTLMAAQRDFQEQKGRLQEELEAAGQEVIFYPKFHCELNFFGVHARLIHGMAALLQYKAYEKSSSKLSNQYQLQLSIRITIIVCVYSIHISLATPMDLRSLKPT
jgi:hypothetical protein